jgi:hypothetical protein
MHLVRIPAIGLAAALLASLAVALPERVVAERRLTGGGAEDAVYLWGRRPTSTSSHTTHARRSDLGDGDRAAGLARTIQIVASNRPALAWSTSLLSLSERLISDRCCPAGRFGSRPVAG